MVHQFDRFHEIEFEKLIDSLTETEKLRIQVATFFGTTNVIALGIAFGTDSAALIIVAGIMLWIAAHIDAVIRRKLVFVTIRIVDIQRQYSPDDKETYDDFIETVGRTVAPQMKLAVNANDHRDRRKILKNLPRSYRGTGLWLPLTVGAVQIVVGIIMHVFFEWPLM